MIAFEAFFLYYLLLFAPTLAGTKKKSKFERNKNELFLLTYDRIKPRLCSFFGTNTKYNQFDMKMLVYAREPILHIGNMYVAVNLKIDAQSFWKRSQEIPLHLNFFCYTHSNIDIS